MISVLVGPLLQGFFSEHQRASIGKSKRKLSNYCQLPRRTGFAAAPIRSGPEKGV